MKVLKQTNNKPTKNPNQLKTNKTTMKKTKQNPTTIFSIDFIWYSCFQHVLVSAVIILRLGAPKKRWQSAVSRIHGSGSMLRLGVKCAGANLHVRPTVKMLELLICLTNMRSVCKGGYKSELLKALIPSTITVLLTFG